MNILVTGGLGYIGSHTLVELIKNKHKIIVVDNLSNSKINSLDTIHQLTGAKPYLYQIDITDEEKLDYVFNKHRIDGVIHFAGLKAVSESVLKPLDYYYNNIVSTIILSRMCLKYKVEKFIFSSSATVYGDQTSPLKEDMKLNETTNPYGRTKAINERMLIDLNNANQNFSVTILRYFNPIGAHPSGLLGENPNGIPNNLMPLITKVANKKIKKLSIFGNDYDTIDGTCIRDYIHVVDLAKGHVKAIEKLNKGINIYNLGTGKGISVLEIIHSFIKENNIDVPYEFAERRPGDLAVCFSDPSKAEKELDWKAELNIDDMVKDSWNFEKNNK